MTDNLQTAIRRLDARVRAPCGNCGLRFGSCAHTRDAEALLDLVIEILQAVDREHQTGMGPSGPICRSCSGECSTRREIMKIIR